MHADFVTYPSLYEGFGNALLEAIYFRKPVLINRYSIFVRDIEPKGFRLLTMDGFVTPTVAKSAAGAIEYVPMSLVAGLPGAITQMRDKGVWVVGLDDSSDRPLFDIANLADEAICLVLGAEGSGISRLVRERCDMVVSIPMMGQLGSLNVSAAAALATYEVARVRAVSHP